MAVEHDMEISKQPNQPKPAQFSQMAAMLTDQAPDSPRSTPSTATNVTPNDKPKRKKNARMKANKRANVDRRSQTVGALTGRINKPAWRIQPWADWNEWLQIKTLLTNNEHRAARQLLHVFTLRQRSTVPIAMTTSVALVSLLNETEASNPYSRRLSLSMAITRFVNGMTDILQPRDINRHAISVSVIADRLRLPPMLVEIRHQASHNQLPALNILEDGARQALLWLDGHYWAAQQKNLCRLNLFNEFGVLPHRQAFVHQTYSAPRPHEQPSGGGDIPKSISAIKNFLNSSGNKDFGTFALQRLRKCIREWSARRSQRLDRCLQPKLGAVSQGDCLWTECGDNAMWKRTPIGLIPGQKLVPRISDAALGVNVRDGPELRDGDLDNCSEASVFEHSLDGGSRDEQFVDEGLGAGAEDDDRSEKVQRPLKNLRTFDEALEKKLKRRYRSLIACLKRL